MNRPLYPANAKNRQLASVARRPAPAPSPRLAPLPLAAALALGASTPWVLAQTVVQPLSGPAATQTVVTTGTLRDGNAFNHFSTLKVGQGDTVSLVVPTDANWLVNVVRDERLQVDGLLRGQLASGALVLATLHLLSLRRLRALVSRASAPPAATA